MQLITISLLLGLSLSANTLLLRHIRQTKTKPKLSLDASQLLAAIMAGGAILQIRVLDQGDFFMRSPRDLG